MYTFHLERDGQKKRAKQFSSMEEAASYVEKMEDSGRFPEGFEAILTHNETGERHMYTDNWEKF